MYSFFNSQESQWRDRRYLQVAVFEEIIYFMPLNVFLWTKYV